jgi:formylglycine-generating enzyme required for sulfatase activity
MADLFISYKREDRERVSDFVQHVESAGFSVWWDQHITPEGEWDDTILEELEAASAVVVLWTEASIKSKWVRTEAHFGSKFKKLIPVRLADCDPPLAFRLNQTVNLAAWDGDEDDLHWRKLMTWLTDLRDGNSGEDPVSDSENTTAKQWRNTYGETESGEVIFDGTTVTQRTPGGTQFRDGPDEPLMCVIPAGSFKMGSARNEAGHRDSEGPRHVVNVVESIAVGVYLVSFAEWDKLLGESVVDYEPADDGWGREDLPVINVSWTDVHDFLTALSKKTGQRYRLLSEAEWEYACRSGSSGPFGLEGKWQPERANFSSGGDSGQPQMIGRTTPIGNYDSNRFGLYDMHGNVREWVEDLWHDNYDDAPTDGLSWLSGHSAMRVLRGGSWLDADWFVRSASRGRGGEYDRTNFIGFRLARDI